MRKPELDPTSASYGEEPQLREVRMMMAKGLSVYGGRSVGAMAENKEKARDVRKCYDKEQGLMMIRVSSYVLA